MSNIEGMPPAAQAREHQNTRESIYNRSKHMYRLKPKHGGIVEGSPSAHSAVITEDLASFLIVSQVVVGGYRSIQELRDYFSNTPEIQELVDYTLKGMEAAKMISVSGDKVECLETTLDSGSDPQELMRYIPNLFRLAAKRVLKDVVHRPEEKRRQKESVVYYTVPDDPKLASKIREFEMEFRAKIASLYDEAQAVNGNSKVRLVGVLDCVLEPEDFA